MKITIENRISKVITFSLMAILFLLPINYFVLMKQLEGMHYDVALIDNIGFIRGSIQRLLLNKLTEVKSRDLIKQIENHFESVKKNFRGKKDYAGYREEGDVAGKFEKLSLQWKVFIQKCPELTDDELKEYSARYWSGVNELADAVVKIAEMKRERFERYVEVRNGAVVSFILFLLYFVRRFVKNELEKNVIIDTLTKLYNRFYFNHFLEAELAYFDRSQEKLSLIFLDIDYFKKLNDTYGHRTGDMVLETVAAIIKGNLRKEDMGFRYGGEEFVITLPNCELETAMEVANRLLSHVENHQFGIKDRVTISIGLTQYRKGESINKLVERADKAMYRAKKDGRNKVCAL